MSRTQYKFYLTINDSVTYEVFPRWGADHSLKRGRVNGRWIVRESIDQAFRFVGNDFETVFFGDIERDYVVTIREIIDGEEVLFFRGEFNKSDGEFDYDEANFQVILRAVDQYARYLESENTEFDLIQLNTPKTSVNYFGYPMVQVYVLGSTVVNNYVLGSSFERPVEPINTAANGLVSELGFGQPRRRGYAIHDDTIPFPIGGLYFGPEGSGELDDVIIYENGNGVRIAALGVLGFNDIDIFFEGGLIGYGNFTEESSRLDCVLDVGTGQTWEFRFYFLRIASRVLTREGLTYDGELGEEIVEGDQFAAGFNFTHFQRLDLPLNPFIGTAANDQGFGRYPEAGYSFSGEFIGVPGAAANGKRFPIGVENWSDIAWWLTIEGEKIDKIIAGREILSLADAYELGDSINAIVSEIDDRLFFGQTTDHSELLYSDTNPITGDPNFRLFLAPKTNVLRANYTQPASKARLKPGDIAELLQVLFQAEIIIDPDFKVRIEADQYFLNGGTYDESDPEIAIDLTNIFDPYTGEAWSYKTNKLQYDKISLPERIEFGWMDSVSDAFEGFPIVNISRFVDRGRTEERKLSRFSSDLDTASSQPEAFSTDGFFIIAARLSEDGNYIVVTEDIPIFGEAQNGVLSFPYLQDKFYRRSMPAKRYIMNNEEVEAVTTRPTLKQDVLAPVPNGLQPATLAKTEVKIGNGVALIDEIDENMISRTASIKLTHGTN